MLSRANGGHWWFAKQSLAKLNTLTVNSNTTQRTKTNKQTNNIYIYYQVQILSHHTKYLISRYANSVRYFLISFWIRVDGLTFGICDIQNGGFQSTHVQTRHWTHHWPVVVAENQWHGTSSTDGISWDVSPWQPGITCLCFLRHTQTQFCIFWLVHNAGGFKRPMETQNQVKIAIILKIMKNHTITNGSLHYTVCTKSNILVELRNLFVFFIWDDTLKSVGY